MDLSVIIINFNTENITSECLDSILKNTKNLNYEIIVIDNASNDGSYQKLTQKYAKYKVLSFIKNKNNLGFSKANNIGCANAKGKYLLFLNSDTQIYGNILKEMTDWMRKNKKTAVATCALKNKDGSLQGSGGYFPTLLKVFSWMFFIEDIPFLDKLIKPFHPVHAKSPFYKGLNQFKKIRNQDWVTGAFFLTKKDVFEKAGRFDEDYFMYTEEVDLCYRIKQLGFNVMYLPEWEIVHLGGASSTKEFPILSEYKGVKMFYRKNMTNWQYPFLRLFLKCGALLRALIFGIVDGKGAYNVYVKAFKIA